MNISLKAAPEPQVTPLELDDTEDFQEVSMLDRLNGYFDPTALDDIQHDPSETSFFGGTVSKLDDKVYRNFPALNASLLKLPTACDQWHDMTTANSDHFDTDSRAEAFTLGILLHAAVLEPWKFAEWDKHFVISETKGLATGKAKAQRRESGLLVITQDLLEKATECTHAVAMHSFAQELLSAPRAEKELSAFYFDQTSEGAGGIWKKARYDFMPARGANFLADVKTTAAPLTKFSSEVTKFGYALQAAWYLDLWHQLTGERRELFYFIVVTKSAPFKCRVFLIQNFKESHPLYEQSLLKGARAQIAHRVATWITSAHETRQHLGRGLEMTPRATRTLWQAYETSDDGGAIPLLANTY